MLTIGAAYATLVLHSASWAEARQLDAIFPFYRWRIRPFSAAELAQAWHWLAALAVSTGIISAAIALTRTGRTEITAWLAEASAAARGLRRCFSRLLPRQRKSALAAWAALTVLRVGLSHPAITPAYDDVVSYELFASKSLLAVSSYYPVPNNHVLSNTLSWLFYHITPGFWFTMRLPVLLAATVGTALLFLGLVWMRAGFRVAWLATVLFSLLGQSLYQAAVGRGYWLLTALAGVVFFCSMALKRAPRRRRIAWSGLLVGSVLGMFTIPTFALVLASAFSWLGWYFFQQRSGLALRSLVAVVLMTGAASLLLYFPLLFVSGPASFFGNGFVNAQTWPQFLAGLPAYLWKTEGVLAGQMTIGSVFTLATLAATAVLLPPSRKNQTLDENAPAWRHLAPAALWFMLAPYAVLTIRHVLAPERTLVYKAFFFFVLVALAADWWLRRSRRPLRLLLAMLLLLWTGYQLSSLWRESRPLRHRNQAFHAAFQWLEHQPRGTLLVPEPTHSLFMRMYLHAERPGETWPLDAFPRPKVPYRYVLAFPDARGNFQPRFAYPPAFQNEQVLIYQLPPATSPATANTPAYWHLAE
ncbi:hypothetical protein [Hymenobacter rubidus]|uniref:hypothetical protein n=1 Tax=Hymenobacter rubidus TaxID=1441626 RepID=UPI00191ED76D|nr:hypothetical protein [Hymenobacter rubidus]